MNKKVALQILHKYQAAGSKSEIILKKYRGVKNSKAVVWEKKALRFDAQGDYQKAIQIFFSLYKNEKEKGKKASYGISLVQQLINISNLDNARLILNQVLELSEQLKNDEQKRVLSGYYEKLGWVFDLEEKPQRETEVLLKSRKIIKNIRKKTNKDKERGLIIDHFIGRAKFKKLTLGNAINKKNELERLEMIFRKNLNDYLSNKEWAATAFNYSWLARVEIQRSNLTQAVKYSKKAKSYFKKAALVGEYGEGLMGHYHRLMGELEVARGDNEKAFEHGIRALRLTIPSDVYYNGTIEAVKIMVEASS